MAPAVTIVRVLGLGGYQSSSIRLAISSSLGTITAAVLKPSRNAPSLDLGGPTSASIAASGDFEAGYNNNQWFCKGNFI